MKDIKIGGTPAGDGHPCFVVAEIGINHNGDVEIAKKLIDVAEAAGCQAVKFQKRTPDLCVPEAQRSQMRETPWGYITYMEYRERVELGFQEYSEIDAYCREHGIMWFASCWDEPSVAFIEQFGVPAYKLSSASITNESLLRRTRETGKPVVLSTGMSDWEKVNHAVAVLGTEDLVLLHAVSVYPARYDELNLRCIQSMRNRYNVPIGYSGHESGIASTVAAVAMGACMVERHITLDRSTWGSDQAASLEPTGLTRMVRDIRLVEASMGNGDKRVLERELPIIARLRG